MASASILGAEFPSSAASRPSDCSCATTVTRGVPIAICWRTWSSRRLDVGTIYAWVVSTGCCSVVATGHAGCASRSTAPSFRSSSPLSSPRASRWPPSATGFCLPPAAWTPVAGRSCMGDARPPSLGSRSEWPARWLISDGLGIGTTTAPNRESRHGRHIFRNFATPDLTRICIFSSFGSSPMPKCASIMWNPCHRP